MGSVHVSLQVPIRVAHSWQVVSKCMLNEGIITWYLLKQVLQLKKLSELLVYSYNQS